MPKNNYIDKDAILKLRMRRLLFKQGYWSPMEVDLSEYDEDSKRYSLTDLDVLGIKYDGILNKSTIIADCKTSVKISDAERLFWLNGVKSFFSANDAYYVRTTSKKHVKYLAPKLNIKIIEAKTLDNLERSFGIEKELGELVDLDLYTTLRDYLILSKNKASLTNNDLKLKNEIITYLNYLYWYIDQYRNLMSLIERFRSVKTILEVKNPQHKYLCFLASERFLHCIIEAAQYVMSMGLDNIHISSKTYFFGGALNLKEKNKIFDEINKLTNQKISLEPDYWNEIIELIGKVIKFPNEASYAFKYLLSSYIYCSLLDKSEIPSNVLDKNIASLVLAKNFAQSFAKIVGISEDFFEYILKL